MSDNSIDYEKGLTFEKVWASIQKLGDKIEGLTDKYDAIFEREAKERQKAKEERQKEDAERRKDADERMKKLEKVVEETSRELKKNMGSLHNSFGTLIEHLVAPNIAEKFNELGYHFNRIFRKGLEIYENGQTVTEVDIVLENDKTIALVEIKSKPNMRDIKEHLERMQTVRRNLEQSGKTSKELIGAIAGAIFPDFVKKFAIDSGFYVITQTGDTVKIDVPENFKPRIF
ncbi:MAG: hypothetical protein LBI18_06090 [Planctomycetaceae bacterium]|jgi:hypothetical protein|nr:hypothetical protein [Planctomycetaceae bacterium]